MKSKPKLLVLLSRIPYPLDKGDKLRAFHQIKDLNDSYEVILCCLSTHAIDPKTTKNQTINNVFGAANKRTINNT